MTDEGLSQKSRNEVLSWLEQAHDVLREIYAMKDFLHADNRERRTIDAVQMVLYMAQDEFAGRVSKA